MATFDTYANGKTSIRKADAAASYPATTTATHSFDATFRNLAAADVIEILEVPAGTQVHNVYVEVITGEASQTINIGDGDDPDGFVAAGDVSTTGTRLLGAGAAIGKFYTAADTIDIEVPATKAFTTLHVRVVVMLTMMG